MRRIHKKYPDLVFEKVTPHCFRHTFAMRWLEAEVPIKTVSAMHENAEKWLKIRRFQQDGTV